MVSLISVAFTPTVENEKGKPRAANFTAWPSKRFNSSAVLAFRASISGSFGAAFFEESAAGFFSSAAFGKSKEIIIGFPSAFNKSPT